MLTLLSAPTKIALRPTLVNHSTTSNFTLNLHRCLVLDTFLPIYLFLRLLLRFTILLQTLFLLRHSILQPSLHLLNLNVLILVFSSVVDRDGFVLLLIFTLNLRHLRVLRV